MVNLRETVRRLGKGGRNKQTYNMALRPPFIRSKHPKWGCKYQDCSIFDGTRKHRNDGKISPRCRWTQTQSYQQPPGIGLRVIMRWQYIGMKMAVCCQCIILCFVVLQLKSPYKQKTQSFGRAIFVTTRRCLHGFFFSPPIPMKTKRKMECENRQWGLRLWSKTNLTFGKGFEAQI